MDEWQYEHAAKMEAATINNARLAAEKANAPQYHPDFDGEHCVSCYEPIPEQRLAMGKVRCTDCQEIEERRYG